jgi:lipopolysaccharide export system protein LptC
MDAKRVAGLLALLALAVGTSLLLRGMDTEEPEAAESPELGIGYYVNDATLTGTGDDGHVLYRMSAARVVQQPANGTVTLENVAVNYDPATSIPWRLTADTGEVLGDGKMIALSGNVVAATREANSPSATIRTDYLEFDPASDIASTDRKVVIDYAGSTVHAVGLRALLREDRLQLRADVAGHYVR